MPSTLDRFVPDEEKDLFVPDPEEEGYESVTPEDVQFGKKSSLEAEKAKILAEPPPNIWMGSVKGMIGDVAKSAMETAGGLIRGAGVQETSPWGAALMYGPGMASVAFSRPRSYRSPLIKAGEAVINKAQEYQVPETDKSALTHDIIELGAGLGPYVVAPTAAPITMALQSMGGRDLEGEVQQLTEKGMSPDDAMLEVSNKALAGGAALGAVWAGLPGLLKIPADKLVGYASSSMGNRMAEFLLKRLSGMGQMGLTAGTGYLAEKLAAGEPIVPKEPDAPTLGSTIRGGAELGFFVPQGPTFRPGITPPPIPGRIPNALQRQAETVLQHVRSQPGEGNQPVPVEGTGPKASERGQPATPETVSKPTSPEATPALGNLNEGERMALDLGKQRGEEVHFVDQLPPGSPANAIAVPGPNGQTLVKRSEYSKWLKERKATPELVESLLDEEMFHGLTPNDVALDYHNSMTAAERALALRRYAGPASARRAAGIKLTPTQLGHEAIRFDWQKLSGKTPREILEAKGMEWLTVQGITALERTIAASRRALGTKASRRQRELLNEQAKRVAAARQLKGLPPTNIPEAAPQEEIDENRPFALNKDEVEKKPFLKPFEEKPLSETVGTIAESDPKAWADNVTHYQGNLGGGITGFAYDMGAKAKTPADLESIKKAYQDTGAKAKSIMSSGGDFNQAIHAANSGQVLNEMHQAATGVGINGLVADTAIKFMKMRNPDYEPPMPDPKYSEWRAKGGYEEMLRNEQEREAARQSPVPTATPAPTPAIRAPMPRMAPAEAPRFEGMSDALRRRMEARAQREASGEAPPAALNKEGKERTLTPAIRLGNRWFTGKSHAEALQKATKEIKSLTPDEQMDLMSEPQHQFLDENGNPLNRKQAAQSFFELTGKRPAREEGLHSEDLRDAGLLGHLDEPLAAAVRKGKKTEEDKAQLGFALPPTQEKETRPTAQELGAVYVPPAGLPTAKALSDAATTHLTESKRPSFNNFVAEVQDQYGEGVQPGQLKELWQDAVWQRLMTAKGSELESLRDSLGLHESLGGGTIEDAPEPTVKGEGNVQARREALLNQVRTLERRAEEAEAQLASQKERMASGSPMDRVDAEALVPTYEKSADALRKKAAELTALARNAAPEELPPVKVARPDLGTFFLPGVSQRLRTMARIGEKLIGQSEPQATRLRRKEITPTDLGFWRTREGEPEAFEPIGPEMARSPDLGRRLTSGASMERTGRRAPPESVTKRVTALLDNLNGKVHLVDTYRKGTGQVLMFDPRKAMMARPHSPLDGVMGEKLSDGRPRFVPLDSYLLDEPVQNFHQTFPSQKEYKAALRDPARDMLREREYSSAERPAIPEEVPAPSVMRTGEPLTDAEARRVYDYFASEEPQGIADVQASLERLFEENRPRDPQTGAPRPLNARELAVVNALDKAIQASPEKGEIQALNRFLVDLYENISSKGRTREEWVKTVTPTVPKPGGEVPPSTPSAPPAAIRKPTAKESLDRKIAYYRNGVTALIQRRFVKEDVARLRDATENEARISGQQSEKAIRLRVLDDLEDAAVIVLRQTRMTPDNAFFMQKLAEFENNVNAGLQKAEAERDGKAIKKGEQMLAAIEYVRKYGREDESAPFEDRIRSRRLRDASSEAFSQTKKIFDLEDKNGFQLRFESGYVPQRYEAERFNDDVIEFGEQRVLGRAFKKARVFRDYFEAYREGYLPKDFRASVVVGSRVRDGMRAINRKLWIDAFKTVPDPVSNEFIIRDLERKEVRDADGNLIDVVRKVPDPSYEELELATGKRYAVRRAYANLFEAMTAKGYLQKTPVGRALLKGTGALKHGLLLLDTFHVGRMTAMGLSVLGRKMGYEKGRSILEYSPEDLLLAVKRGEIPREAISWALDIDPNRIVEGPRGKIDLAKTPRLNRNTIEVNDITLPIGAKAYWTRMQSANLLVREGMNVGRVEDALYRDFTKHIPIVGNFSKWVFDKLTRGVMLEAGLHEFERLNRAKPNLTPQQIAKAVAKDVNVFFGNLGRQGIVKNPFLRDLLQITFLAPNWVESLAQKEVRALSRVVSAPFKGQESIKFGTIGKGMGAGIGAMIIATQLLNLILTKRQTGTAKFTWQNDDKEHFLDVNIPDVTGRTKGFWLSPLSLHAELSHDMWRYAWGKDQFADAVLQIGENKLGPVSRSLLVFGTGNDPLRGKLDSTWSRAKAAGWNLAPIPIGIGPIGRNVVNRVFPGMLEANKPGSVQRQLMGSVGLKTEFAKSATQEMGRKAAQWLKAEGRPRTEIVRSADLPSYSRLRDYIRNGDQAHAFQMMDELLKTHNYNQIKTAMERHRDAPFTGSKELEQKFRNSLTEREQNLYDEAKEQQKDEFLEFMDILRQHRDRP